jgi:hypothetical protein
MKYSVQGLLMDDMYAISFHNFTILHSLIRAGGSYIRGEFVFIEVSERW